MDTLWTNKKFIRVSTIFIGLLCLLALAGIIGSIRGENRRAKENQNIISFSGHGEVSAVPDIATIYFGVEASANTQSASSDIVNVKTKKILDFLKSSSIAEKDIKTENYSSYPKYSNPEPCPMYYGANGIVPPCRQGESKIIGYTVSESMTVKIRKVDDASKIIDGINKIGVTNMSGPNLAIDDEVATILCRVGGNGFGDSSDQAQAIDARDDRAFLFDQEPTAIKLLLHPVVRIREE